MQQHGPLGVQERREKAMCENLRAAMTSQSAPILVLGIAHLHSMMSKLSEEFDVAGYGHELDEMVTLNALASRFVRRMPCAQFLRS